MENKLELEIDGKKEVFEILLKVETCDEVYVLYTQNKKNEVEEIIVYAGIIKEKKGKQVIEAVEDDEKLAFLDSLLVQIQNQANKEVGE